jgi:ubiquinone/menaquinone biosynthesis C-methylase UbiE
MTAAPDWADFWDAKATSPTDFQATGRGLMDEVGFLYTVHEIVRLLKPQPEHTLIDIGCGTGLIVLALAPWLTHIHALDLSPNMVERARRNLSHVANVDVAVGSITRMALPDACGDRLLAYSVLQYLDSEATLVAALQEIFRILRPGGRALLAANPDPARRGALEQVIRARPDQAAAERELAIQDTLLWRTPERLRELAQAAGFRARAEAISERIWQHFYMFDLVLEKV